jgi:hypothetical protein
LRDSYVGWCSINFCWRFGEAGDDVFDSVVGRRRHVVDDVVGIVRCVLDEKRLFSNDNCTGVVVGVLQCCKLI